MNELHGLFFHNIFLPFICSLSVSHTIQLSLSLSYCSHFFLSLFSSPSLSLPSVPLAPPPDTDLVNQNYWIGATEVGHEGIFRWQDGTKVKMGTPFWGIHQGVQEPNGGNLETCVFMVQSKFLYWADALCSDIFSVICEVQEMES